MTASVSDSVATQVMDAFNVFKKTHIARIDALESEFDKMATESGRPFSNGERKPKKPTATFIDAKTNSTVPVLGPQDRLADFAPAGNGNGPGMSRVAEEPSLGRVLRGIVLGNHAHDHKTLAEERMAMGISSDTGGGYLLDDGRLSGRFIDLMRARMVLNQAGALTVPMDGSTLDLVKITADPSVSWHGENQDLPESEPTFGRVKLNARTVVCMVKLSLELAQDAANIEQVLAGAITGAMAGAIDSAGLNGVSLDAAAAPSGLFDLAGRNTVLSVGAPTSWDFVVDGIYELMADNMALDEVGALIAHPALWRKMRRLKTGLTSDNTPLTMPAEVAALPKLWTTAAPLTGGTTAKAIIGKWPDLLFGVRKQITVRVLQERFLADKLQVAVVSYARCDFAATRAASFVTCEGITV